MLTDYGKARNMEQQNPVVQDVECEVLETKVNEVPENELEIEEI